jgi:hypothetical protein
METWQSYGLLGYFALYFFFGFVWRSILVFRQTGINPIVLPATDDAYGYVGRAFKLACTGVVLMAPSAATLVLLVAGELLMQVQVRLEEQHLSGLHGERYAAYCHRVRRWL